MSTSFSMVFRKSCAHTLGANIFVEVTDMPEAFRLVADKGQLETVLVNVAANSRGTAMPSGGRITFSAVRQIVVTGSDG